MKNAFIKNLIIGAGPAGLATAGCMREMGLDFEILEQSNQIGTTWRNHYDRLHLHTIKKWSHFPHLPFPESYPKYVSRQQLVDYMESYAQKFEIKPKFEVEVKSIVKADKLWKIVDQTNEEFLAENVIVSTGVNRLPNVPNWEGQDDFKGEIIHSRFYKNPKPFLGKSVLVVGIGNTGAEVALDLANHKVETYIAVRGEISLVPRDLNGRSVQETAKTLDKLPFGFGDWLGSQIRKIYFGNLSKYGLKISKTHPVELLRDYGKTPLIDIGTIAAIKEGKIKVVGDIDHFADTQVAFKEGKTLEIDAVILATGYRAKIDNFIEKGEELLDKFQVPKTSIATGYHKGLYFVGFDQYKTGGIFGTIFTDSQKVVKYIVEKGN